MFPADFIRSCVALARSAVWDCSVLSAARRTYGDRLDERHLALFSRAAVPSVSGDELGLVSSRANVEFLDALRPLQVLTRLPYSTAPFSTPLPALSAGASADFVDDGGVIPVSGLTFGDPVIQLSRTKIAALVVISRSLLDHAPSAESAIYRDLKNAIVVAMDARLLDPASGAVNGRPASITNAATEVDASGATAVADIDGVLGDLLAALIAGGSSLRNANFVGHTSICAGLAMMRTTGGVLAYPDVTVNGGTLAGIPLLASGGAPTDTLTAIDAEGSLLVADENQIQVDIATAGMVDQNSVPTGSSVVSLFQTHSVALRVIREISWQMRATDRVAYASNFHVAPPTTGDST